MDRYTDFINNPYNPETNFWLGEQYYQEGHKAAALSYFLRAAEYGEDNEDLIYEALLKVMLCLKELEGRPHSTRGAILNTIIHNPERPEAYYHLSYDHQIKEEWHESYTAAIQGLARLNNTKETLTEIDYPGEHALLFQKGVAAWWIGRCDEARSIFQELLQYWTLEDKFIDACHKNLSNIGGERFFKILYTSDQHYKLRYNFKNSEKIRKNYSQVLQDMFVLCMLDGKENGTYIEVGSAGPFSGNNTALLETQFNWKGFSLDIDSKEVENFNSSRKNKCILQDATKADFNALIHEHKLGETIDYLQLDVEPAENTYKVLTSIPFDKYKFRVITYEHDHYTDRSLDYRELSRKFLKDKGYVMVVGDIAPDMNSNFEDWWVHPDLVDSEILETMEDTSEGTKKADDYLLNGFQWGVLEKDQWFRKTIIDEVLAENSYERFTKVEKGDVVVDIGACVGAFTRIIANRKPEKVYCLEPDTRFLPTLKLNTEKYTNVEIIEKGISDIDGRKIINGLYNPDNIYIHNNLQEIDSIKFDSFINEYKIEKIDFLKVDCEGGEYDIFSNENYDWIKSNVKKIAIEVHLNTPELKDKFRNFRENILKNFNNFKVYSMTDNVDIKWWIWDDKFIEYYDAIMVYIDNRFDKPQKWQTTQYPTLEFTTSIPKKGCVIDCAFCPQRTLLDVYDSDKTMSLENFKKIVDKLPKEVRITFSGFTEPWLNRNCTDMLLYAHEQGHPVSAFTTGVGMTLEDVERIKDIPFNTGPNGGFCLHLPDQELIAKHPITPRYLEVVKRFKQLENHIQGFYVMSMSEVHDDVKQYFPDANVPDFWSRAGNLLGEAIVKPELQKIKDRFKHMDHGDEKKTCGCDEELYHNVVLPNGDVSLCCMDYSLSQIIGNLYKQEYEKIIPEPKTCFTICQHCENGVDPT